MRQPNRRETPQVRHRATYLYVQRARVEQEHRAVKLVTPEGTFSVPSASLTLLLLGPGTSITQAAVRNLAATGCGLAWTQGDHARTFATIVDPNRSSRRCLWQAKAVSDDSRRLAVVRRMYMERFEELPGRNLTLQQIRGLEGVRVRETYAALSRETGVPWRGRRYDRGNWEGADSVNRALSAANSALYAILHAALVQLGWSPALGFIHTGTMASFVYDVADLYKTRTSIPAAFACAAQEPSELEPAARENLRELLATERTLSKLADDLDRVLGYRRGNEEDEGEEGAQGLWQPQGEGLPAGRNYADESDAEGDTRPEGQEG